MTFSSECSSPVGMSFISLLCVALIIELINVSSFSTSLADRLLRRMGWKSDEVAATDPTSEALDNEEPEKVRSISSRVSGKPKG